MPGKYFDDLEVGLRVHHSVGRTVTEMDNVLFCSLTMNPQPLHLDEAFAALPEAEQDALTARAVARLKAEAPQVHAWYQDELAAGTAEDAMRPAVLSTLRAFRRDLLADCEDRS